MLVVIPVMFIAFLWLINQRVQRSVDHSFSVIVSIIIGLVLIPWLFLRYMVAVRDQRHVLRIELRQISARLVGKRNERYLTPPEIVGYRISDYPMRFWNFKCLVLYLKTGERWELPQFLYWNFRDIAPGLEQIGVEYLGTEKYRFKWWPF